MKTTLSALAVFFAAATGAHAEQIWLTMDHVRPYQLETPAQSIVVGNPGIADVTVQDNRNLLLFGKAPGMTNIYMFDENGEAFKNLVIRVRSQSAGMLTFYRGSARTTYNCTSNCEATVTVGDDPGTFGEVAGQVQNKFGQAASAAGAAE